MENHKAIYVIHASDADQHLGHLKKILDTFKEAKRVTTYTTTNSQTVNLDSFKALDVEDMVILLLTNAIVENKASIETLLLEVKKQMPRIKIAEVLVDNAPYEASFVVFPASLEPIRASEDMDLVWQGIAENLKRLFPKPEIKPTPVPPSPTKSVWRKYLPYIFGVLVVLFVLGYMFYDQKKENRGKEAEVNLATEKKEIIEPVADVFMENSEIIKAVRRDAGVSKQEAMGAIKVLVETIGENLKKGNRVSISGFGTWSVSEKNGVKTVDYGSNSSELKATGIKTIEKSVIIQEMANGVDLSVADATLILKSFIMNIEKSLKMEKPLAIDGLGKWYISIRPEKTGVNPSTGQKIKIAEKKVIKFEVDSGLNESLN